MPEDQGNGVGTRAFKQARARVGASADVKSLPYGKCMIALLRLIPPDTSSLIVMPRYPLPGHQRQDR